MNREEAIEWIKRICAYLTAGNPIWRNEPIIDACNIAIEALKQPERKTGRWEQYNPFTKPRCSECGEPCVGLHGFDYTLTAYCPNCGAKMGVES